MEESHKKSIANYEITETIHEGPDGGLYRANDQSSAGVLIKLYFPSLTWSESLIGEFFDRFGYLRFIEHNNLLPILDMGKHEGVPYVVYPYVSRAGIDRQTFQEWDEKAVLGAFYEIADALDFLHKQEILHGMLDAGNILMDATGSPKLFDYGLAEIFRKLLLENAEDGFQNLSISRVDTISPEQLLGHTPTRQSDIYAFGMLLFFGLAGQYPFRTSLVPEIAAWHMASDVTQISPGSRKVSKQTLRFIQKCIQVKPENRFPNFAEVLRVLERTRKGKRTGFSFQPRLQLARPVHRRRAWWYALPVGLLLGVAAWLFIQNSPGELPSLLAAAPSPSAVPTSTVVASPTARAAEPTATLPSMESTEATEPTPVQVAAYRPAIERETPASVAEKISAANVASLQEISRLGYGRPEDAAISASGRYVAFATSMGVLIYDIKDQSTWVDPRGWATAVQFSPDEKLLAIGLVSGEIQLWDWAKNIQTSTLQGHTGKISKILFSGNGRFIYSASFDQHVIVWNAASQKSVQDIPAHSDPVNDIAVSSDGRTLISVSDDQLVRVWDLAAGTKTYEIRRSGKLKAVALSSDDVYIAVGGEAGLIWQTNVRTRQLRTDPIPVTERIWSLQYTDNDEKLLAGIDNGEHQTYQASKLRYGGVSLNYKIEPISLPLVKIFGFDFAFDSYTISPGTADDVLSFRWDGEVVRNGVKLLAPFYDSQDRLDFSEDGTVLAAGGKYGTIAVWNIEDNRVLYRNRAILPRGDPISPDGQNVVIEAESIYKLIGLADGKERREYSVIVTDGVVSYADQGTVLIAGNLRESKVWDYESGYETFFDSHPENGCLVTSSANNQEILQVNSAAGRVPAWTENTKAFCAKSFLYVNSISALSTDMQLLVYRNSNGLVEGFDLVSKQLLWKYPLASKPDSKVTALAVSSDGSVVAVGSENGKVLLLDGKNGELLAELAGNFGAVQALKFSNDDRKLATAGFDGAVRIFGVVK